MTGDLDLLIAAARAAGDIAMRYWRQSPQVWDKGGGAGPVTEADLAVDQALKSMLMAARPDFGWLSEETPDDRARMAAGRCFIVDPIDGTRAFVDGTPDFAHSLAIAEGGRVTAAVVYLPARDRLYSGQAGGQACLNGALISVSGRKDVAGATLLTAKASLDPGHWRAGAPPPVTRAFRPSLAWRLCLVAEGGFDGMLTLRPTWEWDIAAGALIAALAGASVTDRRGDELTFNSQNARLDGCIAATPVLHGDLMARLRTDPGA